MSRTTKVLAGAAVALGVGVAGQIGYYHQDAPSPSTVHASWMFHPTSAKQVQARAKSIALVKVIKTEAGPDIVTAQPEEPEGVDRIPTQRVTVEVMESYKGGSSIGDKLTLFQTGGTVAPAATSSAPAKGETRTTKTHQVILEGDPLYVAGEEYLVMLEDGPNGTLRTVSPEGRYRYSSGKLTPMVKNAVTGEISSRSLTSQTPFLKGQAS